MPSFPTLGIVLRKFDWGEHAQLFHICTAEFGKVEAVGRGTKKIQSKLNGHLEPFGVVALQIVRGRRTDQLTGALIERRYGRIISNLHSIAAACYGLELVDMLTQPGQPDQRIFSLLDRYLAALNEQPGKLTVKRYQSAFAVKLLSLLGFQPQPHVAADAKKLSRFVLDHTERPIMSLNFIAGLGDLTG